MTSWKEERDRLVAQTLAFVQQVAAAHPAPTAAATDTTTVAKVPASPSAADSTASPIAGVAAKAPEVPEPIATKPPESFRPLSERDDITRHVEAFRARQGHILKEREAYYQTVIAKIRDVLGNDSKDGRL